MFIRDVFRIAYPPYLGEEVRGGIHEIELVRVVEDSGHYGVFPYGFDSVGKGRWERVCWFVGELEV